MPRPSSQRWRAEVVTLSRMSEYMAIIKHSGDYWIGWIEEVPGVNCQERTREELHFL